MMRLVLHGCGLGGDDCGPGCRVRRPFAVANTKAAVTFGG